MMYVHGPFPNIVFALDLKNENKILWKYEPKQDPNVIPVMCCDTVNRGVAYADGKIFLHQADTTLVALDAKTGKVVWSVKNGDPAKGETGTSAPHVVKDKVIIGISGGEFGVQCHVTAYDIKNGKQVWRGYSMGPDERSSLIAGEDHGARQAGRHGLRHQDLAGRSVEDRRRLHLGLVFVRSRSQPRLLRLRQSLDLESEAASGRQPLVDDDLGARRRHRHGQVGLSDDAPRRVGLRRRQRDDPGRPEDRRHGAQDARSFRSQRSRLHPRPGQRRIAGGREVRSEGQLDQRRRHEQDVADLRPSEGRASSTRPKRRDVNVKNICPAALGTKDEQPAAYSPDTACSTCRPTTSAWTTSRSR